MIPDEASYSKSMASSLCNILIRHQFATPERYTHKRARLALADSKTPPRKDSPLRKQEGMQSQSKLCDENMNTPLHLRTLCISCRISSLSPVPTSSIPL